MENNQQNNELKNRVIQISSIALVDRGKEGNTWKELEVKVKNWEKGVNYSIPLKKKDGEETAVYKMYKQNRDDWEARFINDDVVELDAYFAEKVNHWTHEGKDGVSTYRTIRFFKPVEGASLDEVNAMVEGGQESIPTPPPVEDEIIDLESIPF